MLKTVTYAFWLASVAIAVREAVAPANSMAWAFIFAVCFPLPILLFSYMRGEPRVATPRACLIIIQLPFFLLLAYRFSMPAGVFGMLVVVYLGIGAAIASVIRARTR